MGIIVENGGILTTVQDEGRFGYQAFGVSTSGAMDNHSFHIANILVGNDMGEGALEMTFIGPTLKFTSDNIIATTTLFHGITILSAGSLYIIEYALNMIFGSDTSPIAIPIIHPIAPAIVA